MKKYWKHAPVFLLALGLSACDGMQMPDMPHWNIFKPDYKPVNSDVAAMAEPGAPQPPAAADASTVYCRVSKGSAHFSHESWEDFQPADFTVTSADHSTVTLSPARGEKSFSLQVWYDDPGQKMIFCPMVDGPPDKKISCSSVYMLDDDLDDGIKRTLDIPGAIQGGVVTCAHDVKRFKK